MVKEVVSDLRSNTFRHSSAELWRLVVPGRPGEPESVQKKLRPMERRVYSGTIGS